MNISFFNFKLNVSFIIKLRCCYTLRFCRNLIEWDTAVASRCMFWTRCLRSTCSVSAPQHCGSRQPALWWLIYSGKYTKKVLQLWQSDWHVAPDKAAGGWAPCLFPSRGSQTQLQQTSTLTRRWRRQMASSAEARCWLIIRLEVLSIWAFFSLFFGGKNKPWNEAFEMAAHLYPSLPSSLPTSLCTSTLSKEYIKG